MLGIGVVVVVVGAFPADEPVVVARLIMDDGAEQIWWLWRWKVAAGGLEEDGDELNCRREGGGGGRNTWLRFNGGGGGGEVPGFNGGGGGGGGGGEVAGFNSGGGRKERDESYGCMFCDRLYKPFLFVYAIWIPLLQLKFQNEEYSPFNAQGFFCIMSPIALCITLLLFGGMSCAVDLLQNSGMVYKILLNVACFTGVLAHLSLLFVLLFPPKLNLVGYAIIFVLLMVVVAYTFSSHIKSLDKIIRITWKYVKAFGENKLRSQSTTIIPV
ncbi:hypothetical protein OSB04_004998 [Centaurea solstitialis]|uniref:Uncharacterized protein n=1 Tax=Centaurea solstitialis TaxID=347529 RepID=A0AA38TZT6_9ASTR|nr:hypothetical protein OSB04_004998 [Centaurea solstitialis]